MFLYCSFQKIYVIKENYVSQKKISSKLDSITLDPDSNWVKSWIRIQIQCIWIHNTDSTEIRYKMKLDRSVTCMVYPSDHCHIVATENLGICTIRGSHAVQDSQSTLMICDTVVGELYHMDHGFRPTEVLAAQLSGQTASTSVT